MINKCSNCLSENTIHLRDTGDEQKAPMSDGKIVSEFKASQHLCNNCACIFVEYTPADRLNQYFKLDYDVSDAVQNCQIIIDKNKHSKHSIIHKNLLNVSEHLKKTGDMLEIACGDGELTRKFSSQHPTWACTAVDPSTNAKTNTKEKNIKFIRSFFSPKVIGNQKFDVIIAHGILNRTPTLEILKHITQVAKEDALVSIEIVTLETSTYAPYIWDHSYTYLKSTFEKYLKMYNLLIEKVEDCGSTLQFICKYKPSKKQVKIDINKSVINQTRKQYDSHLHSWDMIAKKFTQQIILNQDSPIAIFGAGLYSAVLVNLTGLSNIDLVVDEVRAGTLFQSKKVIDLKAVKDSKTVFLLCARERNLDYLSEKIEKLGFKAILLN